MIFPCAYEAKNSFACERHRSVSKNVEFTRNRVPTDCEADRHATKRWTSNAKQPVFIYFPQNRAARLCRCTLACVLSINLRAARVRTSEVCQSVLEVSSQIIPFLACIFRKNVIELSCELFHILDYLETMARIMANANTNTQTPQNTQGIKTAQDPENIAKAIAAWLCSTAADSSIPHCNPASRMLQCPWHCDWQAKRRQSRCKTGARAKAEPFSVRADEEEPCSFHHSEQALPERDRLPQYL